MSKTGSVILVIGRKRSGKSPFIKWLKEAMRFQNNIVFDRRKEYDPKKWTIFYYFDLFKDFICSTVGSFMVMEEATGFVMSTKELELTDMLVGIEHNNNVLVMVFHALLDVPPYVLRQSRYIVLFPTNDDETTVMRSRNKLYESFIAVNDPNRQKSKEGWNVPEMIDYNS